ncbi:MAG: serine/threonine-protein kinase, partial [Acidobacteriota bacterium]
MTPERWQQIQAVFESASTRSPAERRALLDQACGDDTELRTEVESLLGAEDLDVTLLDGKVLEIGGQMLARGQSVAGTRLGNYRILREIGRGGMAAVYASVRADEQYHQQVAIKLIRHGMDSERMVARFRQERQILANLVHPNIARLLDGGVTSDGLPYLVMERIDGEPIDTYCDRRSLSIADRLQLFRTVCSAVHYAHQNLVIHRDLKPSNILVTEEGSPKLLDFGIAKLIEPDSTETTGELTLDGPRPMTPEYASPEQVLDRPVTTASDVYALGVLLYRLLTGQRPYRIEQLTQREIERVICHQEPERPSATFRVAEPGDSSNGTPTRDAISRRRDATAEQLRRRLRGDLDNIVRMAMRKTPERRYGSAQQLSEDIRRHLERLPIIARDDSLGYLTAKFIRRNRLAVSAAGLIFLSLTGGLAVALWQAAVARTERLTAQTVASFVIEDVFKVSDPEKARGEDITARQLLERSAAKIDHLADQPIVQAALMDAIGSVYLGLGLLDEAAPHLGRALDLRRQHLSANDPALADSLAHVGEYLADRGRIAEAEALHSEALDLRRRQLDADDPRLAQSEADLALMVAMRGRLDEAEVLMRQALERQQEVLGEDHEKVAETLNSLALVLRRKGQLEEAAPIYRRALDTTIERLGDDHPQVLVNLNNLAIVLCNLGQHSAATSLFERAEALGTKVLGENHSSLATTRSNLASCLQSRGDIEAAEALFRDALDLRRTTL